MYCLACSLIFLSVNRSLILYVVVPITTLLLSSI
nr:MAG TPA: hypothetical protein [Caudoviricetes sp.]